VKTLRNLALVFATVGGYARVIRLARSRFAGGKSAATVVSVSLWPPSSCRCGGVAVPPRPIK
jgi:hypothetical protein